MRDSQSWFASAQLDAIHELDPAPCRCVELCEHLWQRTQQRTVVVRIISGGTINVLYSRIVRDDGVNARELIEGRRG